MPWSSQKLLNPHKIYRWRLFSSAKQSVTGKSWLWSNILDIGLRNLSHNESDDKRRHLTGNGTENRKPGKLGLKSFVQFCGMHFSIDPEICVWKCHLRWRLHSGWTGLDGYPGGVRLDIRWFIINILSWKWCRCQKITNMRLHGSLGEVRYGGT